VPTRLSRHRPSPFFSSRARPSILSTCADATRCTPIPRCSSPGSSCRACRTFGPPAFRSAFGRRRCLIPADGFYEWKKAGRTRQPYFICLKDGLPLAFAGLWEEWRDPDGQAVGCCAIIVTRANALLQPIHERMPVIL
jgi:putative SOS response-associated peptidase YedK